jgi:methylated-DNA-[protein]-cysteine S-methyltransferase
MSELLVFRINVSEMIYYTQIDSPVGPLTILGNGKAITGLRMRKQRYYEKLPADAARDDSLFANTREQLDAYFAGDLKVFKLPLAPVGTPFQKIVWKALLDIPFGATESYGSLAKRIGHDGAARAVGLANGHNPIGIIVPCHRVIGSDGSLTGYGGGLDRKEWLLKHEGSFRPAPQAQQIQLAL